MLSYKDRLLEWCTKMTEHVGWDIDQEQKDYDEKGRRYIKVDEGLKTALTKAVSEADINYGRGISMLYDRIIGDRNSYNAGWADYFPYTRIEDFNEEGITWKLDMALLIQELIVLRNDWRDNEFKVIIKQSVNSDKVEMDPSVLERVNKLVTKGSFNTIKYRGTQEQIFENDQFFFSNDIVLSTDLTHYFEYLLKQQEYTKRNPDQIYVTLFGKMDKFHPIFSNWIFTLHKGESIWVISDQVLLDNPNQKRSRIQRRSLWDKKDALMDACDLPYEVFETVEDLRSKQKSLTNSISTYPLEISFDHWKFDKAREQIVKAIKNCLNENGVRFTSISCENSYQSSHVSIELACIRNDGEVIGYWSKESSILTVYHYPEILNLSFKDIDPGYKTFSLILVNEIIQWLCTKNLELPVGMLSKEFISQKLIESAELDPVNNETRMQYWSEESQEVFNEIIETAYENEETCTGLIPRTYDIVLSNDKYENSWLASTEKLESLSEWLILDKEAVKMHGMVVKNIHDKKDEGKEWFKKILNDKYDIIAKKLKNEVELESKGFGIGFINQETGLMYAGKLQYHTGKRIQKWSGAGKTNWDHEWCPICGNETGVNSKVIASFHFRHYKSLMWLLDMKDRKELHPYYRNYRSYSFVPYKGNSILNQTHPYLRITDPLSRREPNGITFNIYMCGRCFNKIKSTEKKKIVI